MPRRMHRQRDAKGKLVCDSCKRNGFGEWNVAYARQSGLSQAQVAEFTRREAEALASIRRMGAEQGYTHLVPVDGTEPLCGADLSVKKPSSRDRGCPKCMALAQEGVSYNGVSDREPTDWSKWLGTRKVAHDSGDGETIFHCPFCGSGAVVGGHDGTVECGFCHTYFTVQVQPEFKSMPQTIDGQPYNIPGMPGGGPDAGDATGEQAADVQQVQQGQPEEPAQEPPAAPAQVAAMLLTPDGVVLDPQRYMRHLALRFADDRDRVLADVRAANAEEVN
jgi:hypothetical protein